MADAAEFALDADALGVIRCGCDGVERRAALRVGVLVVVLFAG